MKKIYTIRDSKGEYFSQPFHQLSPGQAERTFKDMILEPKNPVNSHPEDFSLYYLGEYDELTGKMKLLDSPQHVIDAIHLTKSSPNPSLI